MKLNYSPHIVITIVLSLISCQPQPQISPPAQRTARTLSTSTPRPFSATPDYTPAVATSTLAPSDTEIFNLVTSLPTRELTGMLSALLVDDGSGAVIMNIEGKTLRRVANGGYRPLSWSPSGNNILLQKNNGLYLTDNKGAPPRLLYQGNEPLSADTTWLTDTTILVETLHDQFLHHVVYVNSQTGQTQGPKSDYTRAIEAVMPGGEFWIQETENGLELANLDDKRILILQDYSGIASHVAEPFWDPQIAFSHSGQIIVFNGCIAINCHIFMADVGDWVFSNIRTIFNEGQAGETVYSLKISPDDRYLAMAHERTEGDDLYVLNLQTRNVDYTWSLGKRTGSAVFFWSPDSKTIIYPAYSDAGQYAGLVKLDVHSGSSVHLTQGTQYETLWDVKSVAITP